MPGRLRAFAQRSAQLSLCCVALAVLAGCANAPVVPAALPDLSLPRQALVEDLTGDPPQSDILVAQRLDAQQSRWILLDLLSVPRARQVLTQGVWHNDGFMPPNPQASRLFSALIFAWTPTSALPGAYGQGRVAIHQNKDGSVVRDLFDDDHTRLYRIVWPQAQHPDLMDIYVGSSGPHWRVQNLQDKGGPP